MLQWTEATDENLRSYVNGIPTGSGGTHESGLRAGIGKAVRNYIEMHNLSPKGVTLTAEDIREGLTAIVSVKVPDPKFSSQTKDKLVSSEVRGPVEEIVAKALTDAGHEVRQSDITPTDTRALDQFMAPDGTGLPPGKGTAADGRDIYSRRCARFQIS